MAEQGFYRTWKQHLNTIPRLQRFQQDGIGASYPIAAYTADGLQLRHFYHTAEQIDPDTISLGPARVLVTLAYDSFEVVTVDFQPFDVPIFEDVAYTLSADQRAARRPTVERLEGLYDQMLATYPDVPDGSTLVGFVSALREVVPPVLWPYYEALLGDVVHAKLE